MSDELLVEQYRVAIDLYKHEDLLNWQKFNNLIYVNTALVGMVGFWGMISKKFPTLLAVFLPILGIIISVCFLASIRAGIIYLHARKSTVVAIDNKIESTTNLCAVLNNDPLLKNSPTTKVLISLPLVLSLFWAIFLLGVLFYR